MIKFLDLHLTLNTGFFFMHIPADIGGTPLPPDRSGVAGSMSCFQANSLIAVSLQRLLLIPLILSLDQGTALGLTLAA
jgi:hypothetical protein